MDRYPRFPEGAETLLLRHEDERLRPYDDKTGKPLERGQVLRGDLTIGVGRNLSKRDISIAESRYLLNNDILSHWSELLAIAPWVASLTRSRQLAMLDLAFNIGASKLIRDFDETIPAIRAGDYERGAVLLLQTKYASQTGSRALRVAEMIRSGNLPSDVQGLI